MRIKITADSRETNSRIIAALRATENVDVAVQELSCGDYLLREDYPVERKSANDFVASIMDRRLFGQIARMKAEYNRATFLIEGNIYSTRSAIAPEALRGAISYLTAIEGAVIVPTPDAASSALMLVRMAIHLQEGLSYEIAMHCSKPKQLKLQAIYMMESMPGIGGSMSKTLLAHFGSVEKFIAADVTALRKVPGIGAKTAESIRAVIESVHN